MAFVVVAATTVIRAITVGATGGGPWLADRPSPGVEHFAAGTIIVTDSTGEPGVATHTEAPAGVVTTEADTGRLLY